MAERSSLSPEGLFGGGIGRSAHFIVNPGRAPAPLPVQVLGPGARRRRDEPPARGRRRLRPAARARSRGRRRRRRVRAASAAAGRPRSTASSSVATAGSTRHGPRRVGRRMRAAGDAPLTGRMRLAVDIGGTFTDGVLIEDGTDRTWAHKVLTTPATPARGSSTSSTSCSARPVCRPADLVSVTHATTITTNTLLQRRGARTALLTTAGFEDILEIGRQIRHALYDLQTNKPVPLVPRAWCHPITERLDHAGRVLTPLDEATRRRRRPTGSPPTASSRSRSASSTPTSTTSTSSAPRRSSASGCRASGSRCRARSRRRSRSTGGPARPSSTPTSRRSMDRYLSVIEAKLRGRGIRAPLHVMGSSGALMTAATARARPVDLVESGPGGRGQRRGPGRGRARRPGRDLVRHGRHDRQGRADPRRRGADAVRVRGRGGAGIRDRRGDRQRLPDPRLDRRPRRGRRGRRQHRLDRFGRAAAGRSAERRRGSGAGELRPRRQRPDGHGRQRRPRADRPRDASPRAWSRSTSMPRSGRSSRWPRTLGIDVDEAAAGVIRVAESVMAEAIRLVSVERGHDPRDFTLIAFGGAGPLHANRLAAELGIPTTVIPPNPSVLSALGMLLSDFRHEHRRTRILPLEPASEAAIGEILERLEADARDSLRTDRIATARPAAPAAARGALRRPVVDADRRPPRAPPGGDRPRSAPLVRRAAPAGVRLRPGSGADRDRQLHRRRRRREPEPGAARRGAGRHGGRAAGAGAAVRSCAAAAGTPSRSTGRSAGPVVIDEPGSTTVVERGYAATRTAAGMLVVSRVERP